jgi:uncharacterized protein (DUF1697 family)
MPRYLAFLRAINVGGHTVSMARLKQLFEAEGLTQVTSYLASGDLSFYSRSTAPAGLEKRLERAMQQALGFEVATFLRTEPELLAAHAHRPYPPATAARAHTLCIGFMAHSPDKAALDRLKALGNEIDQYRVHGRELYHLCNRGLSESTVTNKALEKALGQPVTMRNVKTVAKVAATCMT